MFGLLTILAVTLLAGCDQAPRPADVGGGADLIPADAGVVFSIENPERLYTRIHMDRLLAISEGSEGLPAYLNLDSLRAMGLDPTSPVFMTLLTKDPATFLIALPGDGAAMSRSLQEVLAREGLTVSTVATHAGVELRKAEEAPIVFFDKTSHLVLAASSKPDSVSAQSVAERILDMSPAASLARTSDFREISAKLPADRDIFFYADVNPKEEVDKVKAEMAGQEGVSPAWFQLMDALAGLSEGVKGVGGGFSFVPNGIAGESFVLVEANSTAMTFMRPSMTSDPFSNRVPGTPRVIMGGNMDGQAMWSWARSTLIDAIEDASTEYEKAEAGIKEELGIELEREIITQIMGSGMLVINHVGMVGSDVVLYFQIARPADFAETVTKLVDLAKAKAPAEQGQVTFEEDDEAGTAFHRITLMPFAEICAGVVDDHFVLTTTRARFADIVNGQTGLADGVDCPPLAEALSGTPGSLFYFDLHLITDLLQMFAGFMPQGGQGGGPQMVDAALDSLQLSHILGVSNIEKDGYRSTMTIESGRDDFWNELIDLITGVTG